MPAVVMVASPDESLESLAGRFLVWFKHTLGRKDNTIANYGRHLRSFFAFCQVAGIDRIDTVRFQHIEMYLAQAGSIHGCGPRTLNCHRHALGSFFKWAKREGLVVANPVSDTYGIREPKRLPKAISIPDQERAIALLRKDRSPIGVRDLAIVCTGFFCGLRVQELCDLCLDQVDLDGGKLRVVGKGDKEREIPIIPRLTTILRAYVEQARPALLARRGHLYRPRDTANWRAQWCDEAGERINRTTGTPDRAEAERLLLAWAPPPASKHLFVNGGWNGRMKRVGEPLLTRSIFAMLRARLGDLVPGIHPHLLRHSFASRLRENGADIALIQEALGHASITTTMVYAGMTTKRRHEELTRLLR